MSVTITTQIKTEHEQLPCIACGYIGTLDFYHDRHYDSATITCPKCKRSTRGALSWLSENYPEAVVSIWNPYNDAKLILTSLLEQKSQIEARIQKLKKTGRV